MDMFLRFLGSLTLEDTGAYASVFGLVIAFGGFYLTLRNVKKGERAATRAEAAARDAVAKFRLFESVSGFSTAISALEEIKRLHRKDAWEVVLDRYAALKATLVEVRASNGNLSEEQKTAVQQVISDLSAMEKTVESELEETGKPQQVAKFNARLSRNIERIQEVLADLKSSERDT